MRTYVFLWWAFSLLSSPCFAQIQEKVYRMAMLAEPRMPSKQAFLAFVFNAQSQLIDQTRTDAQGWYTLSVAAGQAVSLHLSRRT